MTLNFTLQNIRNFPPPPPPPSLLSPVVAFPTPFPLRISQPFSTRKSTLQLTPHAKFNLNELLGGRGLCDGEAGLQQELTRPTLLSSTPSDDNDGGTSSPVVATEVPEDAFEKEFMGLTGGFPGGEKGLELFLKKNPPPPKKQKMMGESDDVVTLMKGKKPQAPELPLLMPGMIAIVKNPNNPFYMYCGIVQRITDGKAAVLFEGGIWDRLVTFRLEELERREKGPPMKNPKSAILEQLIQQKS